MFIKCEVDEQHTLEAYLTAIQVGGVLAIYCRDCKQFILLQDARSSKLKKSKPVAPDWFATEDRTLMIKLKHIEL